MTSGRLLLSRTSENKKLPHTLNMIGMLWSHIRCLCRGVVLVTKEMTESMGEDDRQSMFQPHTLTGTLFTYHRHPQNHIPQIVIMFPVQRDNRKKTCPYILRYKNETTNVIESLLILSPRGMGMREHLWARPLSGTCGSNSVYPRIPYTPRLRHSGSRAPD